MLQQLSLIHLDLHSSLHLIFMRKTNATICKSIYCELGATGGRETCEQIGLLSSCSSCSGHRSQQLKITYTVTSVPVYRTHLSSLRLGFQVDGAILGYIAPGDLNPGSHDCTASALSPEPFRRMMRTSTHERAAPLGWGAAPHSSGISSPGLHQVMLRSGRLWNLREIGGVGRRGYGPALLWSPVLPDLWLCEMTQRPWENQTSAPIKLLPSLLRQRNKNQNRAASSLPKVTSVRNKMLLVKHPMLSAIFR